MNDHTRIPRRGPKAAARRERILAQFKRSGLRLRLRAPAFAALHHPHPMAQAIQSGFQGQFLCRGETPCDCSGTAHPRARIQCQAPIDLLHSTAPGRSNDQTSPGLMLSFHSHLKIFLATDPCDLRASFNGLWAAAQNNLGEDPKHGALFIFTNTRQNACFMMHSCYVMPGSLSVRSSCKKPKNTARSPPKPITALQA